MAFHKIEKLEAKAPQVPVDIAEERLLMIHRYKRDLAPDHHKLFEKPSSGTKRFKLSALNVNLSLVRIVRPRIVQSVVHALDSDTYRIVENVVILAVID